MALSAIGNDRCALVPKPCHKCSGWLPTTKAKISVAVELQDPGVVVVKPMSEHYQIALQNSDSTSMIALATTLFRGGFQEGHTLSLSPPVIAHVLGKFRASGPVWMIGLPGKLELLSEEARLERLPLARQRRDFLLDEALQAIIPPK